MFGSTVLSGPALPICRRAVLPTSFEALGVALEHAWPRPALYAVRRQAPVRDPLSHSGRGDAEHSGHSRLRQDDNWRKVFGKTNDRLKDQELILRLLALHFELKSYKKPMKEALNGFMRRKRELQRFNTEALSQAFTPTIAAIAAQLGEKAFRPTRAINAAVFDAVMVGLARRLKSGPLESPRGLAKAYRLLLESEEFRVAFSKSTSDEDNVKARIDLATKAFANL